MGTGRTVAGVWDRVYMDGRDMSGYARSLGPLSWEYAETDLKALSDAAGGGLPGIVSINIGTLNGIFDNTASTGLHALASGAGVKRLVTLARGIRAAPAAGDPCFTAYAVQKNYFATDDSGAATVTMDFAGLDVTQLTNYARPWGVLLHATGAETAVNTAIGQDGLAASTAGGWFWYHIASANGTVTIKAQDAATNSDGSFTDLTGATSGVVDPSAAPVFGAAALAITATVRRYTRWQLVFGTATTATFVCGLNRG